MYHATTISTFANPAHNPANPHAVTQEAALQVETVMPMLTVPKPIQNRIPLICKPLTLQRHDNSKSKCDPKGSHFFSTLFYQSCVKIFSTPLWVFIFSEL